MKTVKVLPSKLQEVVDLLKAEPYVLMEDLDFNTREDLDRQRFQNLIKRLQKREYAVHPICADPSEGLECLPYPGCMRRIIGMRLAKRSDDPIYAEYLRGNVRNGIGKVRKNVHAADHMTNRIKSNIHAEAKLNGSTRSPASGKK